MGKNQPSALERAHKRIYDSIADFEGERLEWRVSDGALDYFRMTVEYNEIPPQAVVLSHIAYLDLVGVMSYKRNQCMILRSADLLPLTAELWHGGQRVAIIDFPER